MRPRRPGLLPAALLLAALPCPAQPAAPAPRSGMVVSTSWLAAHAKDADLVLLHVADTFADYRRGHIPGARFLATAKFIDNGGKLGSELPSMEALAKAFGDLGVTEKSRVVVYTTAWPPTAARAWFTLDALGLGDRAALLDGGVETWMAEDRPVTNALPAFTPAALTPRPRPEARATLDEVRKALETPSAAACRMVDSRPASRFQAGHLTGAANLYWKDTLESDERPVLLPVEKLRALLAARGILPDRKAITYCEVGLQASHGYFLLKYLGYDAAMYDGSWQEWSAAKLPVVTGEK